MEQKKVLNVEKQTNQQSGGRTRFRFSKINYKKTIGRRGLKLSGIVDLTEFFRFQYRRN